MEALLSELAEFKKMLDTNVTCDWDCAELTPGEEFSELATQLQTLIDKHTISDRDKACLKLADLICDDEDEYANMDEALALLEKQAEINGTEMADDIVMMWEPVEYSFTVNQLLEQVY